MKTIFSKKFAMVIVLLYFSVGIFAQVNTSGQDAGKVSGLVSDNEGNPLIGVSITVKGTKIGTVSDDAVSDRKNVQWGPDSFRPLSVCKRISATYAGRMLCGIFAYAADMRYMKISFNRGV